MKRRNLLLSKASKLLLDLFPGAAAAYSTRKLRAAYTGPCKKVRNDSNVELDIPFSLIADILGEYFIDEVALLAHCGVGNGYVVTNYDVTGNGFHETQTTAASQPLIVSNGVVNKTLTGGMKPAPYFTSRFMTSATQGLLNNASYAAIFAVYERTGGTGTQTIYANSNATATTAVRFQLQTSNAGNALFQCRRLDADAISQAIRATVPSLMQITGEAKYASGTLECLVNGASGGSGPISSGAGNVSATNSLAASRIGAGLSAGTAMDGDLPEHIIYTTDVSANRAAIISNQMQAFGVVL